jgi:hypothetical protein
MWQGSDRRSIKRRGHRHYRPELVRLPGALKRSVTFQGRSGPGSGPSFHTPLYFARCHAAVVAGGGVLGFVVCRDGECWSEGGPLSPGPQHSVILTSMLLGALCICFSEAIVSAPAQIAKSAQQFGWLPGRLWTFYVHESGSLPACLSILELLT